LGYTLGEIFKNKSGHPAEESQKYAKQEWQADPWPNMKKTLGKEF
jgi:hypothetical protein